ncbi:lysophospholipase L1-like esterase [Ereboglobus sp. PH5-10]|uniref:GDSL-type esterase/lipase family protein n=1 Tax=Ereboglobus sp. PH5-10 TaxID=2940629 RepID=UPI0024075F50|nr:GDSL-type esterase/lipase family protein [Ereboglobus sp. PH5-10]MDF9828257.1 lysophospholipase L1-like esterase [Ereboglobus sp. PH5-10]
MKTLPKKSFLIVALFLTLAHAISPAAVNPRHERWKKDIAAFEKQDRENPPVQGGVLFLGSSSIRLWKTLAEDFPGVPVRNRGFGGSRVANCTYYFDKLVMPAKPRLIVFFSGGNDINAWETAEEVASDFRAFCAELHKKLPETKLIYISIPITESRVMQRSTIALANTYLSVFCHSDPRLTFLNMNDHILTPEGNVRPEYYLADKLHMNEAGYALWARVLRPMVTAALK